MKSGDEQPEPLLLATGELFEPLAPFPAESDAIQAPADLPRGELHPVEAAVEFHDLGNTEFVLET